MAWFAWRSRNAKNGKATAYAGTADNYAQRRMRWLGGRRHMEDAPYLLPTDDQEINRLDFQHYMLRFLLRGNYAAPISAPASILDVGSGTGRWCTEMATLFPRANVIGTDVVAPATDRPDGAAPAVEGGARPTNYAFVPGDVLGRLPFDDGLFDFVHMRLLLFAIPAPRWPDVVAELVRVTRPGGWIELVETGPQQGGGQAMEQLVQWISAAMAYRGVDPLIGPTVGSFLSAAGVPRVKYRPIGVEVGKRGGRVGAMAETDIFAVMNGVKAPLVQAGITSEPAFQHAIQAARADINRVPCTLPFYVFWGQKV